MNEQEESTELAFAKLKPLSALLNASNANKTYSK